MKSVLFRVYEELNDYLPGDKKKQSFVCRFEGVVTVAALIGAAGIPIGAVDLILRNGEPVKPDEVAKDGDRISVYPVFEALDLAETSLIRDKPLRRPRFVTEPSLPRLARRLRTLGFDARTGATQYEAADIAAAENRILLVQGDIPPDATHALRISAAKPREQAREVLERLDLRGSIVPFGRCPRCNVETVPADSGRRCEQCARSFQMF